MKALIVYESFWGNTEQVARSIAEGLNKHGEIEIVDVAEAPTGRPDADLIIAGGPTHAFSMSRDATRSDAERQGATQGSTTVGLREWMSALPKAQPEALVATFDTRFEKVRRLPGSAARSAAKAARKRGYSQLGHPESFYVEDIAGPLVEGELDRARIWGNLLGLLATSDRRTWPVEETW